MRDGRSRVESIVLGTVQFGVPYGRRRAESTLPIAQVHDILDAAWERGIRIFDTAESYGVAAPRLAEWLAHRGRLADSHVVTKVPPGDVAARDKLRAAVRRFEGALSVTVLTHGAVGEGDWRGFSEVVSEAGAAAGQSVYSRDEVCLAARLGAMRVQAPGNVLDSAQLHAARDAGVPIDLRSVYLQGILLDAPDLAEGRVAGAGAVTRAVQRAADEAGLRLAQALLAGMLFELQANERVVVGIDAVDQIANLVDAVGARPDAVVDFVDRLAGIRPLVADCAGLIDPRSWSP